MLEFPNIDPVAIALGPIAIHWYGLMYLGAFFCAYQILVYRAKRTGLVWTPQQISDALFYGALGVIIGGRLGYVVFYKVEYYLDNPFNVLMLN